MLLRGQFVVRVGVGGEVGEVVGERTGRTLPFCLVELVEQDTHRRTGREPRRAGHPKRDAAAGERSFEQRRLRVGAEQDGNTIPGHTAGELAPARIRDHRGFVRVVVERDDRDRTICWTNRAWRIALDARRGTERRFCDGDDRVG